MRSILESSVKDIQEFTVKVGFRHEDKRIFFLQNCFFHIALAMEKSEIIQSEELACYPASFTLLDIEKSKKLEENYFLMREIGFHLEKFKYHLKQYSQQNLRDELIDAVGVTLLALGEAPVIAHSSLSFS
jgi:hypothetical protein